jgi:hypothetical protein
MAMAGELAGWAAREGQERAEVRVDARGALVLTVKSVVDRKAF